MIFDITIGLVISYTLLFLLSIILKDNSIADIYWGLGFLQVTIHSLILSNSYYVSQIILLILITIWSLRISTYIFSKKLKHKKEDRRYAVWRENWKNFYIRSFFQIYVFQGLLLFIISIPLILSNIKPIILINPIFITGIIISLTGLIYETIGDYQLRKFVKNKKPGEIMTKGLWKYSRHPNYFGESVFWLGISVASFQISYFVFVSFILITLLLRFISGVPMAEKNYLNNKEFREYMKKTPPMIPNFFIK